MSPQSAQRLDGVIARLSALDAEIGEACVALPTDSGAALAALHDAAVAYMGETVQALAGASETMLLGAAETTATES